MSDTAITATTLVTTRALRAHLGHLVTRAAGGERLVITRNGRPVAAVVPLRDLRALEQHRSRGV